MANYGTGSKAVSTPIAHNSDNHFYSLSRWVHGHELLASEAPGRTGLYFR